MSPGTDISIYAELLSNIRQVSVVATLPASSTGKPQTSSTTAEVSADGTRIRVHHGGQSKDLVLPGTVKSPSALPVRPGNNSYLSWRLQLAGEALGRPLPFSLENQEVPWESANLIAGSSVSCRKCAALIVPESRIRAWKDLPSENWAEMMEFWHCHKPTDHDHKDGENLARRGYGANSSISAQSTIGFVDLTSFSFAKADCSGLVVSPIDNFSSFPISALSLSLSLCLSFSLSVLLSVSSFSFSLRFKIVGVKEGGQFGSKPTT
jgi:ubiquitin-protein ligase E3 D